MLYKKNHLDVYSRLARFYGRDGLHGIFAAIDIPNPAMRQAIEDFQDGVCSYPDLHERIAFWDRILQSKADVADDSLPMCYCSELDEGLVPGLFHAPEILFMMDAQRGWISSMSKPFMKDLEMPLVLDRTGLWADRMFAQYRVFAEGANGKFGVAPLCALEGLNFLVEMRGATGAYLDIMDEVEPIEKLLKLSVETQRFINDAYFSSVGLHMGGTVGLGWQWAPGRNVMDSVDAFHMTSEALFERWGRPAFETFASFYDGSHVHIHANAYRMIPYIATLKGLTSINLGDDPYNPPAMERISEFDSQRGTVPLIVSVQKDEFVRRLDQRDLPGNTLYHVNQAQSAEEANEIMRLVREYRI
jgi:hypothetical protein